MVDREDERDVRGKSSWVTRLTLWWTVPFFKAGYRGTLKLENLPNVPKTEDSETVWRRLDRSWEAEMKGSRNPSFLHVILKTFGADAILPIFLLILAIAQMLLQPYLVVQISLFFNPVSPSTRNHAIVYATLLACSSLVYVMVIPHYVFLSNRLSIRLKAAIMCAIYKKVLRLNTKSFQKTDTGFIINLIATDVEKCEDVWKFYGLPIFPLEAVVIFYVLLQEFGSLFLLGVAVCFTAISISFINTRIYGKLRTIIGQCGDKRITAIKGILSGMRLVKMFCWEDPLTDRVQQLRRKEIKYLTQAAVLRFVNFSLTFILGRVMIFAIFTGSWWLDIILPYSAVIIAIGWLDDFQVGCREAVRGLEEWLQFVRSIHRIQEFLMLPEQKSDGLKNIFPTHTSFLQPGDITIKNIYAEWLTAGRTTDTNTRRNGRNNYNSTTNLLTTSDKAKPGWLSYHVRNVSLKIKAGELIAVTGPVGSGKSSLLLTLLGELPISEGEIQVCGDKGYVQQQPWIFHGTIRENILMFEEFEEERYDRVIYSCGLTSDIELMPHKDLTLVGERGLMLSGGQKARVTLARAIYKDVPILLLDDPLSAVDTAVGKHIFQHCICGLLSGKTRILVTHQLQYLKSVDRIVTIENGMVISVSTFDELIKQRRDNFAQYGIRQIEQKDFEDDYDDRRTDYKSEAAEGIDEESNEQGTTDMRVYLGYFKAGYGLVLAPIFILLLFAAMILLVLSDLYLIKWTKGRRELYSLMTYQNETTATSISAGEITSRTTGAFSTRETYNRSNSTLQEEMHDHIYYMIFFGCSWFTFPISFVIMALFMSVAGRNLHRKTFPIVLAAKMRFFDSRPIGRILNRFSRDIGFVDSVLQYNLWNCFTRIVTLIVFIGMISYTNFWLTFALIPLIVTLYLVSHVAVRTTRQLKRLEATARSPLFSSMTDTMAGLPTIRSMGLCDEYFDKFNRLQNAYSAALFTLGATDQSYTFACLVVFWIYLILVVFMSIFVKEGISTELIGLSLVYVLSGAYNLHFLMRALCTTEIQMTSVERILAYKNLPPEAPRTSDNPPPSCWPSSGEIVIRNVDMKYHENGPLVLRNINLVIKGKEKIGVVGRTGAGKSSLVTLLFRLAEQTGEIWIDNIDITKIGLHDLRKKISVLPQDPVLLVGSLRYNLDILGEQSDTAIWEVLDEVNLRDTVEKLPGQLHTKVSEGGNNFSVGERQLLCLARTILRHNKILILDEATANVDYRTDRLIQETVRRKFADCTVITVAHRLQTIMDTDRVMVLDDGEVKEFDKPEILLQREQGHFRRLAEQTGMARVSVN